MCVLLYGGKAFQFFDTSKKRVKPCRKAAGICVVCVVCVCLRIHALGVGNEAKLDAFAHGDVGAKDAHGGIFIAVDGGTADGGCQVREDCRPCGDRWGPCSGGHT